MRTPDGARSSRVWVVLAAYNEESALPHVLQRIADSMREGQIEYRVIVVDDGSEDETATVATSFAKSMHLDLERHEQNQGLGATIRDGLWLAASRADGRDVIVTLDADNTHTPDLILRMVRMVREGHDVVIASRYRPGSRVRGVTMLRRLMSRGASLLLRLLFPTRGVRDYTSGYRAYRADVIQQLIADQGSAFKKADGFQVMVDILLELRRRKELIFGEAPLILRYDHKDGASKMNVGRTVADTLRLVARRRFS